MSSLNGKKQSPLQPDKNTTLNHEGHRVHQLDPVEVLFSKVMGSFFGESTFYEKRDALSSFNEVRDLVHHLSDEDREYALKIALLGRENNMVHFPLAVLTACFNDEKYKGNRFNIYKGLNPLPMYTKRIVTRGKDVVDVMTFQMKGIGCEPTHNKRNIPLPMQLRKCMKSRLEDLSDYTLSKGLCEGREVSLADCIKMLHPNPQIHTNKGGREDFYKDVIEGRVKFAEGVSQVQTELVSFGQGKKVDFDEVIATINKSSLMAVVKNLVGLSKLGVFADAGVVNAVCEKLQNYTVVRRSKMLPFRFYSAYKIFNVNGHRSKYTNDILDSLEIAMDLSCDNVEDIDGYNAILLDRSGSMRRPISSKSVLTADEVGAMLAAIVMRRTKGDVFVFGDKCKLLEHVNANTMPITRLMEFIRSHRVGGSTYIDGALKEIEKRGVKYDNLIILTDGDVYTSNSRGFSFYSYSDYSGSCDDLVNAQMKKGVYKRVFLNNLMGNTFSAVNVDDYRKNLVVGFTDKFVDMINLYCTLSRRGGDIRWVIDRMVDQLQLS